MAIYIHALYQQYEGSVANTAVREAVQTGDYSNESWMKTLELYQKTVDAGAFQVGYETTDYVTSMNLFMNAQAAMFYMGSLEMSMANNQDIPEDMR